MPNKFHRRATVSTEQLFLCLCACTRVRGTKLAFSDRNFTGITVATMDRLWPHGNLFHGVLLSRVTRRRNSFSKIEYHYFFSFPFFHYFERHTERYFGCRFYLFIYVTIIYLFSYLRNKTNLYLFRSIVKIRNLLLYIELINLDFSRSKLIYKVKC